MATIECSLSNSLPNIVIVRLGPRTNPCALASNNLTLPPKRITINLAPADILKTDTTFDLGEIYEYLNDNTVLVLVTPAAHFHTLPIKPMDDTKLALEGIACYWMGQAPAKACWHAYYLRCYRA